MVFGSSEIHSIRESVPQQLTHSELGDAIRSIVQEQGNAAFTSAQQCRVDTTSQYLPAMEISTADQAVIRAKKEAMVVSPAQESATLPLEGGVRGLLERTSTDNSTLTTEEIKARLGSKDLAPADRAALTTILKNFDDIDTNDNGEVSRDEINRRERDARNNQVNHDRLAALQRLLKERFQDIDRNGDGQITEGELGRASGNSSLFNSEEKRTLNWAHDTWAQTD